MEAQQASLYPQPPPFSPSMNKPRSFDMMRPEAMELEIEHERKQRAASVLSGLSADDLEAAETLKSLQQGKYSTV